MKSNREEIVELFNSVITIMCIYWVLLFNNQ